MNSFIKRRIKKMNRISKMTEEQFEEAMIEEAMKEFVIFQINKFEEEMKFYDELFDQEEKKINGLLEEYTDPFLIKYKKNMEEAKKGHEEFKNKLKKIKNKIA